MGLGQQGFSDIFHVNLNINVAHRYVKKVVFNLFFLIQLFHKSTEQHTPITTGLYYLT